MDGTPTLDYAALVFNPAGDRILLLASDEGWALPRWTINDGTRPYWQTVDGVNHALRDRFGLATTALRCLRTRYDPTTGKSTNIYAMELRDPTRPLLIAHRWIGAGDLARSGTAQHDDCTLLNAWFGGEFGGPDGPPWYQPGWAGRACAWIDAQLARLGHPAIAPVEQVRSWERSSLWRARTATGHVYFKAVPPIFAHEVVLSPALNAYRPGSTAELLAYDTAHGWMLLADLGDRDLTAARDLATWEAALRAYAEVQVSCVAHRNELLALGCPHRPLAALSDGLAELLADEAAFLSGTAHGLTPGQIARLRAIAPDLRAACAALAAYDLPETVDHGDLWASNVFLDPANPAALRFLDWSDSAVTHPFFGPRRLLIDAEGAFPNMPDAHTRLREAYLAPWFALGSTVALRDAFALAQRLAPLDYALLYHQRILPAMCARWELAPMLPYFAGMLL